MSENGRNRKRGYQSNGRYHGILAGSEYVPWEKIQIAALTMPNKMAILNDDKSILSITVISGVELDEIS